MAPVPAAADEIDRLEVDLVIVEGASKVDARLL